PPAVLRFGGREIPGRAVRDRGRLPGRDRDRDRGDLRLDDLVVDLPREPVGPDEAGLRGIDAVVVVPGESAVHRAADEGVGVRPRSIFILETKLDWRRDPGRRGD